MTTNKRNLKPREQPLSEALRRRAEHEAEAFLAETPDDYLSPEELVSRKANLMARIETMEREEVASTKAGAVTVWTEWRESGQRWLKATRAGIEQLAADFNPPPALAGGYRKYPRGERDTPTGAAPPSKPPSPKPSVPWVPVDLRVENETQGIYRLVLMHLQEPPAETPAVTLFIGDTEVGLDKVDYATPPMLHLVFRTEVLPKDMTCRLGVSDSDENTIKIRLSSEED